jgi:hypothetical protein
VGLQELRHLETTLHMVPEAHGQRLEAAMHKVAVEWRGPDTSI